MPRPAVGIWLTTAIWILVIGGIWAYHDYQLDHGREISLKTVPVDPRDILRGDYVVLRYEISTAKLSARKRPGINLRPDQIVFVAIEEIGGEWRIRDLDTVRPDDGLYLRGRVRWVSGGHLEIVYDIESFFVPEGEGSKYEEARNRDRLWAVVSVSPHGVAHLIRLEIR